MFKKLCMTGLVVAAAAGTTLLAAPAHADANYNASRNSDSQQSGNNVNNVVASNVGGHGATNVNNIVGNAVTSANGSHTGIAIDD
ncbi:hypothetical protein ACFWYW_54870 [Nonomuraea sp. NPDC059023]|uniref:hypothetical protein n=1 Tax=unclassified Nonomuraea TaxID=2593643 RepID=UPI00369C7319